MSIYNDFALVKRIRKENSDDLRNPSFTSDPGS
jgi:hypothetical protein